MKPGHEPSAIVFVSTVEATLPSRITHFATLIDTRLLCPPRFPEPDLTPSYRRCWSVIVLHVRRGRKESVR